MASEKKPRRPAWLRWSVRGAFLAVIIWAVWSGVRVSTAIAALLASPDVQTVSEQQSELPQPASSLASLTSGEWEFPALGAGAVRFEEVKPDTVSARLEEIPDDLPETAASPTSAERDLLTGIQTGFKKTQLDCCHARYDLETGSVRIAVHIEKHKAIARIAAIRVAIEQKDKHALLVCIKPAFRTQRANSIASGLSAEIDDRFDSVAVRRAKDGSIRGELLRFPGRVRDVLAILKKSGWEVSDREITKGSRRWMLTTFSDRDDHCLFLASRNDNP